MFRRQLILAATMALTLPAVSWAAAPQFGGQVILQWGNQRPDQFAYRQGYDRGQRAGDEDGRRGDRYRFDDESDYRRGDAGYQGRYGSRDSYRDQFRRGFEAGYRAGYQPYAGYDRLPPRAGQTPPWSNGREYGRFDPAAQNGFNDGYDAGVNDARDRNRFDPISERRYRSADHGYDRDYGSKSRYQDVYRDAFKDGYEQGYRQRF